MGRFSRGSVLLLILLSTVSVVYYSKRCHCYKFQRISYSKRGSKFTPQRTLSESATRSRSTEHAGRQNIRFNRRRKTEKSLGLLGAFARNVLRIAAKSCERTRRTPPPYRLVLVVLLLNPAVSMIVPVVRQAVFKMHSSIAYSSQSKTY